MLVRFHSIVMSGEGRFQGDMDIEPGLAQLFIAKGLAEEMVINKVVEQSTRLVPQKPKYEAPVRADYTQFTKAQLKEICDSRKIKCNTSMTRPQLLMLLMEADENGNS